MVNGAMNRIDVHRRYDVETGLLETEGSVRRRLKTDQSRWAAYPANTSSKLLSQASAA